MTLDADPEVRGMVAAALGAVDGPLVIADLCRLLEDSDLRVACAAAQSLGEHKDSRSLGPLVDAVKRGKSELTCAALLALGQLRDPRAFPAVVVELFSADDEVRRDAAGVIGSLGDHRALEPLFEMLKDPYLWVRANAALSLGFLADPRATEPLLDLLAGEEDETVRGNAIAALGACDPEQAGFIIKALLDEKEQEKARVSAGITLATLASADKLPDEDSAREAILSVLADENTPDETRAASVWALGRMPSHPDITAALVDAVEDDYRWVVLYALESLALQDDADVLDFLKSYREKHAADEELVSHIDQTIKELEDDDGQSAV